MHSTFTPELDAALSLLASSAKILVASDFDGTIARISLNPSAVTLDPTASVALRQLSELPNTEVCILSGRGLSDLASRCAALPRARLVGSHGSEFDLGVAFELSPEQAAVLTAAEEVARALCAQFPGALVEVKPHGVAVHSRALDADSAKQLANMARIQFEQIPGAFLKHGQRVVECCAVEANKGLALHRIQQQLSPSVTLFVGDDVTDEDAFCVLSEHDVTIKVGPGKTSASLQVESIEMAVRFLAALAERRSQFQSRSPETRIDHHVFLSDLRAFAILDKDASVVWLCTPRMDGAPLFGSLVGGPGAGAFSVEVLGGNDRDVTRQEYLEGTNVCRTSRGGVSIVDFLDCSAGRVFQRAGRSDLLRVLSGSARVRVTFSPRLDFGRIPSRLVPVEGGLKLEGGQHLIALRSPGVKWQIERDGAHDIARAEFVPEEETCLELCVGTSTITGTSPQVATRLATTERFWRKWVSSLVIPELREELVRRSALVLRGLTYGPSGALAAAATTSLPECLGGSRNWDYRFCWPRDAALSAHALLRLGDAATGMRLLDWLLELFEECGEGEFLRPVYTVSGRHLLGEAEVSEAVGYRGSRPVRVGNLAAQQLQLDTLGPIAQLLGELARQGAALSPEHYALAERMVALVESRWQDPDHGIWEVRTEQRHFVHSKLMCWQTVVEALEVARYLGVERPEWLTLRDSLRADIEQHGFDDELGSYTAAYGYGYADAALLWVVLSGFHAPDHPRAKSTVAYVTEQLLRDGAVYRYLFDDALSGHEGSFYICTGWLIEVLVMMGRAEEARALFEQLCARVGPLGLMAEQWDVDLKLALGNFPQAYSHLAMINAAWALSRKH